MIPASVSMSLSFPITFPFTETVPSSQARKPQIVLNKTVFPEPLCPTSPYIRPLSHLSVTSFKTLLFLKLLLTCDTSFHSQQLFLLYILVFPVELTLLYFYKNQNY